MEPDEAAEVAELQARLASVRHELDVALAECEQRGQMLLETHENRVEQNIIFILKRKYDAAKAC